MSWQYAVALQQVFELGLELRGNSSFFLPYKCTFPGGSVEALLDIRHGIIEHCTFFGDFMARGDIALVTKELCGLRYQVRDVDEALARLPIDMCFGTLKREEILKCLFNFESGFSDG